MLRPIAPRKARYVPKQVNGIWAVFDNVYFGNARAAKDEADAAKQAADLNARHATRRGAQ